MTEETEDRSVFIAEINDAIRILWKEPPEEALDTIREMLPKYPEAPEIYFLLGMASWRMKETGHGLRFLKQAHELDPDRLEYADALANLSTRVGKLADGVYYAKLATALDPHPDFEDLLPGDWGNFYKALAGTTPSPHFKFGLQFYLAGMMDLAKREFYRELRLNPRHAGCLKFLGRTHSDAGEYKDSLGALVNSLKLDANDPETRYFLGETCYKIGEFDEALAQHRQALLLDHGSLELAAAIKSSAENVGAPTEQFAEALPEFTEQVKRRGAEPAPLPPEAPTSWPAGERIRVGYLCNAVYNCDTGIFLSTLLENHDRTRFEVHCYQESHVNDALTRSIRVTAENWRFIGGTDDEEMAILIANDGLDVLIDLCGSTVKSRRDLIATHPALIQAGFGVPPYGAGTPGIDFVLSDTVTAAADHEHVTDGQQVIEIPSGAWSVKPFNLLPQPGDLPAASNGQFTLGAKCDLSNLTPKTTETLKQALAALPDSKLHLLSVKPADAEVKKRIAALFSEEDLKDRVSLYDECRRPDGLYPEYFETIDLFLELGGNTGGGCLWQALQMGVPALTHRDTSRSGLAAASQLTSANKDAWVFDDGIALIAGLKDLCADTEALSEVRKTLREDVLASLLFRPEYFMRGYEQCLAQIVADIRAEQQKTPA